ncbi:sulfotransferase [Rhodovibrionaceae bacterium A322]
MSSDPAPRQKSIDLAKLTLEQKLDVGLQLSKQNQGEAALTCFRAALNQEPENAKVLFLLGRELIRANRFKDAEYRLLQCQQLDSENAQVGKLLGPLLRRRGAEKELLALMKSSHETWPKDRWYAKELARCYFNEEQLEEAEELFEELLKDPEDTAEQTELLFNLGVVKRIQGYIDEALVHFEELLAIEPNNSNAFKQICLCKKLSEEEKPLLERMEELVQSNIPDSERMHLYFTLGKVRDQFGDYDEAFAHYRRGNSLSGSEYIYFAQNNDSMVEDIIGHFQEETFRKYAGAGLDDERPLFILGMPRSGTTLTEQILSAHPAVFAGGERREMPQIERYLAARLKDPFPTCMGKITRELITSRAEYYRDRWIPEDPTITRVTDKLPVNFRLIGLASLMFPKARVIHCQRHPYDVCLSIYFQNFVGHHPYAHRLEDIAHYYLGYEKYMAHWRKALPLPLLEVTYEQTVADPEQEIPRIIDFAGLPWDDACLEPHKKKRQVRTASSLQVRQPIYKSSTARWQRYEKYIEPLRRVLGDR